MQEEPMDQATIHEPLTVSPTLAKEPMLDPPDRSAENAASINNQLALNNVSRSSPKSAVLRKRKRQEADALGVSPKKRIVMEGGANGIRDEAPTSSTNGTTGHGGRSSRASSGKLPRPKTEQRNRLMAQIYPAVQKSGDIWNPTTSPKKQAEKSAPRPTTMIRDPPSPKATPRPRGRPPKVGPSPTKKTTYIKKRHWTQTPDIENLPQTAGPNTRLKVSRTHIRDEHKERALNSKSTRSTAAARGHKDVIMNANTDLTKKPERDARRAARQRRSREQASVSTPPSARVESRDETKSRLANEEHEEEEEEPQREESRDPEEAMDEDHQTSTQVDEGEGGGTEAEEEDSDLEDSTQVIETHEEENEGEEELELFDQDVAWKTVLEGARSICGPKLPLNQMPKVFTRIMRNLIHDVREARVLYEEHLALRETDRDFLDGLNDHLEKSLDGIEDQIKRLSEKTAGTKSSEMIRDIFARAIPAMVFLLQSALASRTYHSVEPCDLQTFNETVNGLREIVRLQKMAILLCEKATHWKAKPVSTSRPIVRPITWKIFPSLKHMREAFVKKLSEQERKIKLKENAVDSRKRQDELVRSSQHAKQEAGRKNEILLRKIRESREQEDETRRIAKRTLTQIKEEELRAERQSRQADGHHKSITLWSNAEDIELYFQLEKGYAGGLTSTFIRSPPLCHHCSLITLAAKERYLNILNTRLLQNKLPEHIRERALYFKPTLLEERGPLEWISSIE